MNKMYKKTLIFFNNPWIIGIAIIVSIIIIPYHASPELPSAPRPLKADGRNAKKALLLSQDFESFTDITAAPAGGSYNGVSLVSGKSGNGLQIKTGGWVTYPTAGHFNVQKGTIEFWVAPLFDMYVVPANSDKQVLFDAVWSKGQRLYMAMNKFVAAPGGSPAGWGLYVNHSGRVIQSIEPYAFNRIRPNEFCRIRLYWDFSLGASSYMLLQVNDVYQPLLRTTGLTPATFEQGLTPGTAKIGVGCRYDHRYAGNLIIDSLKVYDTSLAPRLGGFMDATHPFPQYNNVAGNKPFNPATDIPTYDSLFAGDGFCSAHETHATQPADCPILAPGIAPGQNVIAFERPPFEWVLPNYVPAAGEIKKTFTYIGIPLGEYETAFFNLYSRIALTNMELSYTALSGPGTIAKSNLDLRVVYNWFQGSTRGTPNEPLPSYVPEMMLHCDRWGVAVDGVTQADPQTDATLGQFKIPRFLKADHVHTTMAANTSKQFGLIVHVPSGATPGNYTGTVTVKEGGSTILTLTLNFTVLPFALRDNGVIAMPWVDILPFWWLARGGNHPGLDAWDCYKKVLQEQVKYGLLGAVHGCFYDYDNGHNGDTTKGDAWRYGRMAYISPVTRLDAPERPESYLEKKIRMGKEAGIKMACLYAGGVEYGGAYQPDTVNREYTADVVNMLKKYGYVPYLLGRDEFPWDRVYKGTIWPPGPPGARIPNNKTVAGYDFQCMKAARIHEVGGKCFVNQANSIIAELNAKKGYTTKTLHLWPYKTSPLRNITYTAEQIHIDAASYIVVDGHLWEMVRDNSLKVPGMYETYYFQTRCPYSNYERYLCGYFRYLTGCNAPQPTWFLSTDYNDFSRFTSTYGVVHMAVDQTGAIQFIPTLHACAMREGFKDDKFLATWKYYRDRVATSHRTEVAASDAAVTGPSGILSRYKDNYRCFADASFRNSPAQFAADRAAIIKEILILKKLPGGRGLVSGAIPGR